MFTYLYRGCFIDSDFVVQFHCAVLVSFVISPALKRIRGFYILLFGLTCGAISPFLFAIPFIPPETTYWAFGFPAMALCCSVEIVWPVISLLVAEALPPEDQALGGGLLQTANNLGRALGLAIATVAQTAIADGQALRGLRAAQWTNVGMVGISFAIGLVYFRKLGKR
jgi:MFS family permease